MVLHIALNGKDKQLNNKIIQHLQEFYKKKQYKITTIKEQPKMDNQYTLNQQLLLKSFHRNKTYQQKKWNKYQLILWNGSIIDDYQQTENTKIPYNYVTKINKYNHIHDIYITIGEPAKKIPRKYNHHNIPNNDKLFEEIVKTIFDNLPRCQWCGKLFKPNKNNYKYCTKKCSKYSLEEQLRINNRNYYHRYKDVMTERQKGGLGSKNANLHGTPDTDPLRELEKVRNAKRALGLKPIQ